MYYKFEPDNTLQLFPYFPKIAAKIRRTPRIYSCLDTPIHSGLDASGGSLYKNEDCMRYGLSDRRFPDPKQRLENLDFLRAALRGLTKKERIVVVSYYFLNMLFREIGSDLDLTESRISQIHDKAIEKLQERANNPNDKLNAYREVA